MSLQSLKKKLALDQVNILTATVISDGEDTVRIRTRSGKKVEAVKTAGMTFLQGDQVEIKTDGATWTVTGNAPLATLSGEKIVMV